MWKFNGSTRTLLRWLNGILAHTRFKGATHKPRRALPRFVGRTAREDQVPAKAVLRIRYTAWCGNR